MQKKSKFVFKVVFVWLLLVIVLFLILLLREKFFEIKLNSCDINQDGIFSPEEQTEIWKYYEQKVIGDGGVAMFPFYISFLLGLSFIINLFFVILGKIKRKR